MQYIDKTESLEKGIVVFPFIYIMGASATGKSVAIRMLCEKHPEVKVQIVDMQHGMGRQMSEPEMAELLMHAKRQMERGPFWLIFENVPEQSVFYGMLSGFAYEMPENGRVILAGREWMPKELVELYWKRRLELIPQAALEFTREDTKRLQEIWQSPLDADEVWRCTGGWAGCADVLFRTSVGKHRVSSGEVSLKTLIKRHEIISYICDFVIGELTEREQHFLQMLVPFRWVDISFCEEVLGYEDAASLLQSMNRRGLLKFDPKKMHWKAAALFENVVSEEEVDLQKLGAWYEKHYYEIPFGEEIFEKYEWTGQNPQHMYLRGMKKYYQQDFEGMKVEIRNISQCDMDGFQQREMLLNLYFVLPEITLDEWLNMVEKSAQEYEGQKFRLYNVIGNSCTYLCGLRDLAGMFACTRKEENRRAKIWQTAFGEMEWKCYQLARLDYYLETQRVEAIGDYEWSLLREDALSQTAQIYLLGKAHRLLDDEECGEQFRLYSDDVLQQEESEQQNVAEAVSGIHTPWINESERLTRWLKSCETEGHMQMNEKTYMVMWCMAKGYLLLNQYKKAEKILKRLIPYLQTYRRGRLLAEAHLQQAVIHWENNRRGLALQSIIESFYISEETRYVALYSNYGKRVQGVLEAYEEWHRQTSPDSWSHKKKYPYGNVLRMPMSDYIGVIMRGIRREARVSQPFQMRHEDMIEERLTMMETLVLQEIGRGLSNTEICIEQNLKMPTVKSHIYSLYKKLGVSSRVQATIKGKELGLLE